MAFSVQLNYGREKVHVEVPAGPQATTLSEFRVLVSQATGVPPPSQKILFQGRTLRQDEATLEDLKITASSRIILLGRKVAEFDSEKDNIRVISQVEKDVDEIEKKITGIEEEVEGIEKGFVPRGMIFEACRGLSKRCITCNELLMQYTEKLDAVVSKFN